MRDRPDYRSQPKNCQRIGGAEIDFAIGDRWRDEFDVSDLIGKAGLGAEDAVVEFVGKILSIIGAQRCHISIPRSQLPDNAVRGPISRDARDVSAEAKSLRSL